MNAKPIQHLRAVAILFLCLLFQACATPVGQLQALASQSGLEQARERSGGYDMLVFSNSQSRQLTPPDVLRVYLEGDGSPWRHRVIVMSDPTPRNPLMLRLMAQDTQPAVYLGRPCYNGYANDPGCDNSLWTSARYSDTVISAMAGAIRRLATRYDADHVWLMGHSGGGTLAMLLAARLPAVTRVVTLAANLDTDAWTRHHRYTPLYSSLNPAYAPELRADVWQWHMVATRDQVVPAPLIKPVILAQPYASGFEMAGFSHGCCWESIWPEVLRALALDDPALMPGEQFKFRQAPSGNQ